MAAGNYWMALMNLYISPWQVIWPRVVLIVGLSMIFASLNVAAFMYTPTHLRGAAVGLFALLRNEGGSVGTSMAQTIQQRREQFHTARFESLHAPAVSIVGTGRGLHTSRNPRSGGLSGFEAIHTNHQEDPAVP